MARLKTPLRRSHKNSTSTPGLWATLTTSDGGAFAALQPGQGVRLSAVAVDHFATVLVKSQMSNLPKGIVVEVLKRLRGVVRRQVEDEQLLLYLLYPWAWFSESMRQLKLPYGREKVHEMLADLGRLGGKHTESQVAPHPSADSSWSGCH